MNYEKQRIQLKKVLSRFFGVEMHYVDLLIEELGKRNIILCGGAINSIFTNTKVADLDFYCSRREKIDEALAYLNGFFNSADPFITDNAISLVRKQGVRVYHAQLITRFIGEPSTIFKYFDFTVTMGAFDFSTNSFVLDEEFLPDIASKRLVYGGNSMFPICAMYRTLKYQKKGYTLPGSTVMHIALSIVRLDIKTYKDLKEHLMGIDTFYLQGLLANERSPFRPELPVNYGEFLKAAFESIDGFSAEDEREENE